MRAGNTAITRGIALLLAALLALGATVASAQNLFAPVRYVNDHVITAYELQQRVAFQAALSAPGGEQAALDALTNERLQVDLAERLGVEVTEEEQLEGEREFAARGELEREQFLEYLASRGVEPGAFRDFVRAGLLWRKIVRDKFGPITSITDREVRLEIDPSSERPGVRLLFSEIFLPARNAGEQARSVDLANRIMETTSISQFAAFARQYSVAPTRGQGGRVNWVDAADLPPALAQQLTAAQVGQVVGPLNAGNAIGLFQLRAIEETAKPAPDRVIVDYAAYYIDGGRSPAALERAAKIAAEVQICNDLYEIAQGQPESVLERGEKNLSEVPQDVAVELAKLDRHEISTNLTRAGGQTLVLLMLCERRHESADPEWTPPQPEVIREQLLNRQLGLQAENYLAELRANANIREP